MANRGRPVGSKVITGARAPKTEKEELLYYKGVYQIRELIAKRVEIMQWMADIDKQIAQVVVSLKQFATWKELGSYLNMSEQQARTYFLPLMGEIESPDDQK